LAGVGEHRGRGFDRGRRQRQDTAGRYRVDGHGGGGQPAASQDLREQAAEGMADDGRLGVELLDDLLLVGGDALAGEHAGIFPGQFDGGRIVGPARSNRAVAGLLEETGPSGSSCCLLPAATARARTRRAACLSR
jgi:hypothetical protein